MAKTKKPSGAFTGKAKKRPMRKAKKQYTPLEKYQYHDDRTGYTSKYGIKYGGAAHCYSLGFCDAWSSIDNTHAITHEFGNRSGAAYSLGVKRGKKARRDLQAARKR